MPQPNMTTPCIIKEWQSSPQATQLFTMPYALCDLVMSDNAVMDLFPSADLLCLYSGGHYSSGRKELYLFYESASGYTLFRVYDRVAALASIDWESFKMCVSLTVYYPFPSPTDALD